MKKTFFMLLSIALFFCCSSLAKGQNATKVFLSEKEYLDFAKEMASRNQVSTITNNNTINNINMYYIVDNFKKTYNIEDLMSPPLTDNEIEYIQKNGPTRGCYKLLKDRVAI